jgi:hypothetical protein
VRFRHATIKSEDVFFPEKADPPAPNSYTSWLRTVLYNLRLRATASIGKIKGNYDEGISAFQKRAKAVQDQIMYACDITSNWLEVHNSVGVVVKFITFGFFCWVAVMICRLLLMVVALFICLTTPGGYEVLMQEWFGR